MISIFLSLQLPLFSNSDIEEENLRIACVGDSLTFGFGLLQRDLYSYPAQLAQLLPPGNVIRNFGVNGACATPGRSDTYLDNGIQGIIDWNPDVLLIMLGSNDSKESNWQGKERYIQGMRNIIFSLKRDHTEIVIITPPPCHTNLFRIRDEVIRTEIIPALRDMCGESGYLLIDLYNFLGEKDGIYIDNIHLNRKGYSMISNKLAPYLLGLKRSVLITFPHSGN